MDKKAILFFSVLIILIFTTGGFAFNFPWTTGNAVVTPSEYKIGNKQVSEVVTCYFSDDANTQKCYSSDNKWSCSGIGKCEVKVKAKQGQKIEWKSSCGGYEYTKVDGKDEYIKFDCTPIVSDNVKCVFTDSTTTQICYSENGDSCKGEETCVTTVSGRKGEQITWKSTCGGYAYTVMDGQNDYAEFKCNSDADIKEQVKCIFDDTTEKQECYSEKGSCTGVGTCVVDLSGKKGEEVTWKSSCGGYAYTIIDGQNEYAKFACGVISPTEFYRARWECYDGYDITAQNKVPLSSETWRKYAEEDCKGHCYPDGTKCGVNSFSVFEK